MTGSFRTDLHNVAFPVKMGAVGHVVGKSGAGPPQSKTLCATRCFMKYAKRLGVRQSSVAVPEDKISAIFPLKT
jgi:ABC-type ATPase with predicted acetyltransferase domain